MKRSFKLLLCIIAVLALLVACDIGAVDTHGHEFVDANGDNVCDTCNTDGAATHGHAMVDANNDGICDTCATAAHEHTYQSAWSFDANYHWHAAACEHGTEVSGKAAHTLNKFGVCTVCDAEVSAPDLSTIDKALEFAIAAKNLVENGEIVVNGSYFGNIISYIFANDHFYIADRITQNVEAVSTTETWFSTDANGAIFGVTRDSEGVRRLTAFNDGISIENLNGYKFTSPLAEEVYYYGVEDLIASLWEFGADDYNGDLVTSVANGVYAFSYGYFDGATLYIVEADFTLSDEYYIENANVNIKSYARVFDWDILEYVDQYVTIPGATDEDEPTYAVIDGAEGYVEMDYTISQNVELSENEYPADEVIASDFTLVDADGNEITNIISTKKGVATYLYLTDILPDTAILSFTTVKATGAAIDDSVFIYADTDDDGNWAIYVNCYAVGEHEIVLTINGVEMEITVDCAELVPTDVEVNVYEKEELYNEWWGEYYYAYVAAPADSVITVWAGTPVILGGFANQGDNLNCTVTVNGVAATLSEIEAEGEYGLEYIDVLVLDNATAGEYEIVFTSVADETLSETVTVIVKEIPDMEEVLSGKYAYTVDGVNVYAVEFDADIVNLAYLVLEDGQWVRYAAEYYYEWTDDGLVTTLKNGYDFDFAIEVSQDTEYEIVVNDCVLEKTSDEQLILGTWSTKVYDYAISYVEPIDVYYITFNADGTGVFEATGVVYYFTYTVEFDEIEGVYVVSIADAEGAENVGTTTAFGANARVIFAEMFSMTTYSFEWTVVVYSGETDEWENLIDYAYSKPSIEYVDGYVWPTELSTESETNIYNYMFENGVAPEIIELMINALPGKYVVYVSNYGDSTNTPITDFEEFCFVVNGIQVAGILSFEVDEAQNVILDMQIIAEEFDYNIWVQYTPADDDDDEGDDDGEQTVNAATITVTTDYNSSLNLGTYTYTIDEDGNITIYNGSEVASFNNAYALTFVDGVLTINSTTSPKVMVKYDGEDGVLAGSWKYVMDFGGEIVVYDITFTAVETEDDDEEIGGGSTTSVALNAGANSIVVSDDEVGGLLATEFTFVPEVSGEYKFASNDLLISAIMNGTTPVAANSGFYTLEAGVTYTVTISAAYVFGAGTYTVNVTAPQE